MKRAFTLLLVLLGLGLTSAQAQEDLVVFVKAGGNGNGTSWTNATGDLQKALKTAAAYKGDVEIWIAKGKYYPTITGDRNAAFIIPDKVRIYGGFVGNETDIDDRNWKNNPTILSGEIGATNSTNDNSYTVVYTKNVSRSTLIDGIVITAGSADGMGIEGEVETCGAGWFNDGSNGESSPTLRNCVFINNYARLGAGLYNYAKNGKCQPKVEKCVFVSNRADFDGGAIYNDGNYGVCSPIIEYCTFAENEAIYGAGLLNRGAYGESRPLLSFCVFVSNISIMKGSSVYNNHQDGGTANVIMQGCRFENNTTVSGLDGIRGIREDLTTENSGKSSYLKQSGSGY